MKKSFSKRTKIILSMVISIIFLINNVFTVFADTTNGTSEIMSMTISGTVKAPDGTELASGYSGHVDINNINGSYFYTAYINDGKFSAYDLPDGDYTIRAYPDGESLYSLSEEKHIIIKEGAVTEATAANLDLRLTITQISGTVKSPDGIVAFPVSLYIQSQNMGLSLYSDNGKFKIGGLADGSYKIQASPADESLYGNSVTKIVTIKDGAVTPAIDANLELALSVPQIIGTVKNSDGTLLTSGYNGYVNIQAQNGDSINSASIYNGKFNIGALSDGDYSIKAVPSSSSTYTQSAPKTISIRDGVVTPTIDKYIELKFTSPQILGTVKVSDGTELTSGNNGYISIRAQNTSFNSGVNIYDGKFYIGDLPDGTYLLQAIPNQNLPYTPSIEKNITIVDGVVTPATDKNIEFQFISPQILGTVKAPDGADLDLGYNGNVRIQAQNGGFSSYKSIFNGKFYIAELSDGTYNIQVYPSADLPYTPSVTKTITIIDGVVTPTTDKNIEFEFTSPQITGTVTGPDSTALASGNNGYVSIQTENGWSSSSVSIYNGKFNISELSDGNYNLIARPNSDSPYTQSFSKTITIMNGVVTPTTNKNIELQFTKPQIVGTVKAPDGIALASGYNGYINVQAQNSYSSNSIDIYNGKFRIGGLSDGTYNIYANPPSDGSYIRSITKTITIIGGVVTPATDENIELQFTSPQISGTVTAPDGIALASDYGGSVNVQAQGGGYSTSTGIYDGNFYIGGLPDGTYNIKAQPSWNSSYTQSMSKTITIVDGVATPISDATLELQFTNPQIVVTVKAPDGTPISSEYIGYVEIESQNTSYSVSIYNGSCNIGGLEDGVYTIKAYPNSSTGFKSSQPKTITIIGGEVTPSSDAILELQFMGSQITGTVKASDGTQLASGNNGFVSIKSQNGSFYTSVDIYDGKFSIDNLEDGSYTIYACPLATSNQYLSKAKTITIIDGAVTPVSDSILELQFTGPQITGAVKASNGTSLPLGKNGFVDIKGQDDSFHTSVNIIDGKFTINGLNDGIYTIIAYPLSPSNQYPSKAKTITIKDGVVTPMTDSIVELQFIGVQVTGTVKNLDGTVATSGYVEVRSSNGSYGTNIGIDINGNFSIGGLEDGVYSIKAYSYVSNQFPSKTKTITIKDGVVTPTTDSTLALQFTVAQITGNVKSSDGTVATSGYVEVRSSNGSYGSSVSIDINGNFSIGGLEDGVYSIKAFTWIPGQFPSNTKTITIKDGVVTPVTDSTLELQFTGPQIIGTVKNSDGTVATSGYVEVRSSNGSYGTGTSIDVSGKFNVGGLPDGTYNIKATQTPQGSYTASTTKTIIIKEGAVTPATDGIIELQLAGFQITGTVKAADGKAESLAHVEIKTATGVYQAGTSIDSNGNFRIGSLPDGTYKIKATISRQDSYTQSTTKTITIENGAVTPLSDSTLELQFTGIQITGTVKAPDGTELAPGYYEYAMIKALNGSLETSVNMLAGRFKIGGLEDGVYTIKAYSNNANQYPTKTKTITIENGAVTPSTDSILNLQFTSVQITGTVKTPDGAVATSGYVDVLTSTGSSEAGGMINFDGTFNLGGLSDGTYTIKAMPNIESSFTQSMPKVITIKDGVVTPTTDATLDLQFTKPQITGTIKSLDGTLITSGYNGYISIQPQNGGPRSTVKIFNGKFNIGGLSDGSYDLQAKTGDPYSSGTTKPDGQTSGDEYLQSAIKTITIKDGEVTPLSDATLEFQFYNVQITGTVKIPDGTLATSGYIKISAPDLAYESNAPIDKMGNFYIGGLSDGTYNITAYPKDNSLYSSSITKTITIKDGKLTIPSDAILELSFFEKANIDKNGVIDMSDLTTEATHFGETTTTTVSNEYDLNGDGVVDIFDLIIISKKIK